MLDIVDRKIVSVRVTAHHPPPIKNTYGPVSSVVHERGHLKKLMAKQLNKLTHLALVYALLILCISPGPNIACRLASIF